MGGHAAAGAVARQPAHAGADLRGAARGTGQIAHALGDVAAVGAGPGQCEQSAHESSRSATMNVQWWGYPMTSSGTPPVRRSVTTAARNPAASMNATTSSMS